MIFKLGRAARSLAEVWENPLFAFLAALVVYALFSLRHGGLFDLSGSPYFNYLADAFLHGQLSFRLAPPSTHDLVIYQGKLFAYWPPFPAVMLLPWVALFGVNFSDVAFTVLLGAANVGLAALLLRSAQREGLFDLTPLQRGLLVLFFAFGTVHLVLAPLGRVWFTSQVVTILCLMGAYLAALQLRGLPAYLLVGLGMACAMATRMHVILAGIWPAYWLLQRDWGRGWRTWLPRSMAALAGPIAALVLIGLYNYSRFGSVSEVGIAYHQMSQFFRADYEQYGYLSLYYVPINLYYQYIYYPFPVRSDFFQGGSLFLLSPVFFGAFWGIWRGRRSLSTWALLAVILLVNIPILLLMGTGWRTFGPRYTLDFVIPLLLLTGMGVQSWRPWILAALAAISILQYVVGFFYLSTAI